MSKKQNDDMWFDDPEWNKLQQKINSRPVEPARKEADKPFEEPKDDRPVNVSINLTLPTYQTIKPAVEKLKKLPKPRLLHLKIVGVFAIVLMAGLGTGKGIGMLLDKRAQANEPKEVLSQQITKPAYAVSLPPNNRVDPTTVTYDNDKKVASYKDQLNGVEIIVSQQPMPANFKDNQASELEKVAKNFAANEVIEAGSTKAYLGTSAKGPQSLITSQDGFLIFIRSNQKITNDVWKAYVTNLKPQNI